MISATFYCEADSFTDCEKAPFNQYSTFQSNIGVR